ncbi:MAG: hypothetical protein JKY42_10245 [Flavobacteriales bacterium]|nr:hypothetical protein [Flavobacteriales bacterium]
MSTGLIAQQVDSTQIEYGVSDSLLYSHSPMKASIMSAIVPGLGQIYNSKKRVGDRPSKPNYLKVPLIYAGMGAGFYFLSINVVEYNSLKASYLDSLDLNSSFNDAQALSEIETTRRYAEISVIAIAAVYVLNIVDASVGAHLYHFDVSDDLSLNFQPIIFPSVASNTTFVGGTLQFKF